MGFDELVQLVVAIAFVAFFLPGSSKKKRPPVPRNTSDESGLPPDAPSSEAEVLIREALGLVERKVEVEAPRRGVLARHSESPPVVEPEAYSSEGVSLEGVSLEVGTSRAEQEARHRAFHEMYVEGETAKSVSRRPARTPPLRSGNIREAIVWQEILGPPKGLQ